MDRQALENFREEFLQMASGATILGLVGVADRTGLFKAMAGQGPLTLEQIVERTRLQERYLREILPGLAAARMLRYEPGAKTFELPEEQAACLADEQSPHFMCGWTQMIPAFLGVIPDVARAVREGGGVPFAAFGKDFVEGMDRSGSSSVGILLTRRWLKAMPNVVKRLERGGRAADVGCGSGAAVIAMARAYPNSEIIGFDVDAESLTRARAKLKKEGMTNARFEQITPGDPLPAEPPYDLITAFDVVHDIAKPLDALRAIRNALAGGGTFLMVEPTAGDKIEDNLNMVGAMLYAMSTLHCLTQSLANAGEGLGAAWGPKLAECYCRDAGFTQFRRLDVEHPMNSFYEIRP